MFSRVAHRRHAARFFRTPAAWHKWLEKHHASATELWVGYYKRGSGTPGITWPESVDEALCFGWIDGVRRSIDGERYQVRFSPRRNGSVWSTVNVKRVAALRAAGRMSAAGEAAYAARRDNKSGIYAYEQRPPELVEPYLSRLTGNAAAWRFFQRQPPSYRRTATWWVISAKQERTRERRCRQLVEDSAAGRRIGPLRRTPGE